MDVTRTQIDQASKTVKDVNVPGFLQMRRTLEGEEMKEEQI